MDADGWAREANRRVDLFGTARPFLDGRRLQRPDDRGRGWTDVDAGAVRAFAMVLGRLIGSITDARHKTELTAQLQSALSSRVLIEQAKGVVMEREGVDAQRAFELLRRRARSSERKMADVARELLARRP